MSERENSLDAQSLTLDSEGKAAANPSRSNRAVIVLAGGRSSRFGSNKALQTLAGKPLIRHIVERMSNVSDHVLAVIGHGESRVEYQAVLPSHVRVINDELEGKNPLVGIVTGLKAAKSNYAAVLACDIPFVNDAVIKHLFRRASGSDAAIPRWNTGRIEPLEAVYRRLPTLRAAQEALAEEGPSQKEMISRLARAVYVSVEDELRNIDPTLRTFFNVNTRNDVVIAERFMAEKSLSDRDASLT